MTDSFAVEADVEIAAGRGRNLKIRLNTGSAGLQGFQGEDVAAVGSELGDLLPGNDAADFASIGLHGNRIRLDVYCFLDVSYLQLEVDAVAIPEIQGDVPLLICSKSRGFGPNRIVSDRQAGGDVLTIAAGGNAAGNSGICVADRDFHVRNSSA